MKVGFAGAGSMAAAMARGWAAADGGPSSMLFTDRGSGRAAQLAAEVGGEVAPDNTALAAAADVVVLAVKPHHLDAAAAQLAGADAVLSVLGATPLARLAEAVPGTPVFRVMPNLAVEVGRGVVCLVASESAPAELAGRLRNLLGLLGTVVEMDEALIDAATAVMGCSPAYVALVTEAIASAGAAAGLDADLSRRLVVETIAGTAELLRHQEPATVRAAVASRGGSTEAGLDALERAGTAEAFRAAVEASLERMRG